MNKPSRIRRPIQRFLKDLEAESWAAVIFGGLARDLAVQSGLVQAKDVDIVVPGAEEEDLASFVSPYLRRRSRFGGYVLNIRGWRVDIWTLESTWAFREGLVEPAVVECLPDTTFLDVGAVAIEVNSRVGKARQIYESGFVDAVERRTVGINLRQNPYPALCALRAIIISRRIEFSLSSELVSYIIEVTNSDGVEGLMEAQRSHYDKELVPADILEAWIKRLHLHRNERPNEGTTLPSSGGFQLELYPESYGEFDSGSTRDR